MNMKKLIKISLSLLLIFLIAFSFLNLTTKTNKVSASQNLSSSFYETDTSKAVFENTEDITNISNISLKNTSVNLTTENIEINASQIIIKNLPQTSELVEGNNYNVELATASDTYILPFMYVTKVLRTSDDFKIFDIATPTTNVYGYYVLDSDIDLGDEVLNKHDGLFTFDENGGNDRGPSTEGGFWGTFNGLGHNITFTANRGGFFGRIFNTTQIINTGFVDIQFKNTTRFPDYFKDSMPIIAKHFYSQTTYGLIKNCYFSTAQSIFGGAILASGSYTDKLKIENIVIEAGNLKNYSEITGFALGVFIGHQENSFFKPELDQNFKNIYVISGSPLGIYASTLTPPEDHIAYDSSTGKHKNGFIKTYASNRGIEENIEKGIKVFKNIKQYLTYNELIADKSNDFSSFSQDYWISANNRIKWKNSQSNYFIDFSTDATATSDNITLTAQSEDKVIFYFSQDGINVDDAVLNAEMLSEYEVYNSTTQTTTTYTYQTDVVEISNNNTKQIEIIPVKEGVGRVLVKCEYGGKNYEKTIKLTVKPSTEQTPPPQTSPEDSSSGGCGTITDGSSSNGGGMLLGISALFILGSATLFIKKNLIKN